MSDTTAAPVDRQVDTIRRLNEARDAVVDDPEIATRIAQYEMAFRMQTSVPELVDFSSEPQHIKDLYGTEGADGSLVLTGQSGPRLAGYAYSNTNYIVAGQDHRGAAGSLSTEVEQQYRITCPTETETIGFYPGIGFPMSPELDELPLGHEFSGTSQLATTEVTWHLLAVSE